MASPVLPLPLSVPTLHSATSDTNSSLPHSSSSLSPPKQNLKTPTIRSRLSKLCQEGQHHLARQLFDTLPRPSTVIWNTIIIGFICNNMPNEALLFYCQMKSAPGTKCDSYTYSSTLKACAETRNLRFGKAVIQSNDYVLKVFGTMRKRNVIAWNTVIAWYVKTNRYAEAVMQLRMMMKMGIKPSPVSFVNVFPAVSNMRDSKIANVLYGLLLRLGSEYVNDLFVVSSAIFMYAELCCVDFARKIFDLCSERNTEVWNTMIGGYVQNNCPIEGIGLFRQAIELEHAALDDVTFLSALSAVSQLQCLKMAEQIYAFVLKRSVSLPIVILNAIIVMYSRCNSIETSFNIFHKMLERDVVSWNTMISAFVQNGLDEEALMLVHEMQKQGFMINSVTVTALLSAASNLRNRDIGKQTHAYLIRHDIQFEGMESYLIDMYAKSGMVRTSERLFEHNYANDRDEATWNAMIAGYTQNGLYEEAFIIFRKMLEKNLLPNAVTIASVLPACSPIGSITFAKQLHGFSIRHCLDQNVYVGTGLIDTYSKAGTITYAENVFMRTPARNCVTYTAMVLCYGQHGMADTALSLFHSMKGSGIKPDVVTFVAILSACGYAGLIDEGLDIFESMEKEYNVKPSTEHYCCVTDMLGRVGKVIEAYEFVKGLGDKGNVMEIWGSLLGACRNHGCYEMGEVIAKKLLEMETESGMTGYHVLLSNIYADEGEWDNVNRVRKQMKEKGMRKETGCSWIEVVGSVNCFVSRDRKHPQCDEINNMLETLAMEMKDSCNNHLPLSNLNGVLEFDE
ncbi:Pentatricopeptide repeat [Quillaja saponaria]|uniref:Pentatricopeptide repeat n=1 Tax=Quillaja saponaria TaxID=32244 RepID=A0AAD7LL71_QUISA|nr:Pentatricopeptide repeat [Quillaja saponaria]